MRKRRLLPLRIFYLGLPVLLLSAAFSACGDEETTTPTPSGTPVATTTATATSPVPTSPTSSGTETGGVVTQFPPDVQPLVENLPENLAQLLLTVRQAGPATLTYVGPGGENFEGQRRAFWDDWEKITGWTVQSAAESGSGTPVDFEVKVTSGNTPWDIIGLDDTSLGLDFGQKGLLEPLDLSVVPTDLYPDPSLYGDHFVGSIVAVTGLAWNTEAFPTTGPQPTHVNDLFNTADFPGKRCVLSFHNAGILEMALMADGVPPGEVYQTLSTEEGLDRALAKLDTIKDDLVFTESGAESVQFVLDRQCDLSVTWNGRVALRVRDEPGLPLAYTQNGGFWQAGPWAIPKGAKNYDAAMSAIGFAQQPESTCKFLDALGYGVTLDESCLTDFAREWGPHPDEFALTLDPEFYVANNSRLLDGYTAWIAGG